mgnify:CR=1 FL=1
MATISIAFVCSMALFGALCHAIGPEDGCGTISCSCCCSSKPKDNELQDEDEEPAGEQELVDMHRGDNDNQVDRNEEEETK